MNAATQCFKVLEHLKYIGSLTQAKALELYGVARLTSRVNDLKRKGIVINTRTIPAINRFGERVRVAEYSLPKGEQKDEQS